jgi:hypothetical protein
VKPLSRERARKQTVIERRTSLLAAHAASKKALECITDAIVTCIGPETDQLAIAVKALRGIASQQNTTLGAGLRARGIARAALVDMAIRGTLK